MSDWIVIALVASGAMVCVAALHPFVMYPISLLLVPKRPMNSLSSSQSAPERPSLALCMAAYNEEKVIVAKAESLIAMARAYGPATIHVYVDGASDATASLLAPYSDRIDLIVSTERRGKTAGMNILVKRSASELLAFTDANVETPANALVDLAAPLRDPAIGCTSARLIYSNSGETPTAHAGSLYWQFEEFLKRIESSTVGLIGVDGAMFLIRRSLYEAAPPYLIDDLYVSLIVLIRGLRAITVDHVVVYERNATHWKEEFRRKRRIACQAMNVHRALWPRLKSLDGLRFYAYMSHRPLKWSVPFLLTLGAILFACGSIVAFGPEKIALTASICLAMVGVATILKFKPILVLLTSLASLAGVAVGVLQSLFTRATYIVWTPAESVRD